jgi:hypothetical protein
MVCSSAMQQLGCTGTRPKCPIRQLPAQIQGAIGSAVPVGGAETCGSNHFAGLWTPGLRNCVERCAPRYVYPLLAIAKSSLVESFGDPGLSWSLPEGTGMTHRQLLEEVDRPALTSLPAEPYEFSIQGQCASLRMRTGSAFEARRRQPKAFDD